MWRFYQEASLYGREVYCLGGQRGPSLCYFVPYLSAMQLFTPTSIRESRRSPYRCCSGEVEDEGKERSEPLQVLLWGGQVEGGVVTCAPR